MALRYPDSKRLEHVDTLHGVQVADPYRWLEAPADTPEVRAWIEAQNALTESYLAELPARDAFKARLTELWNFPKRSAPFKKGGRYFQLRNSGLQDQNVLYVMADAEEEGRVLLDPNTLSAEGTVALRSVAVSPDGRHVAYAVSERGSDWQRWRVREVESGRDLEEVLEHSKFGGAAWLPDGSGFYYTAFPAPAPGAAYTEATQNCRLLLHRLGTPQTEDHLIYARPDEPQWMFHPQISDDERYLLLTISRGTEPKNLLYYREVESAGPFTPLIDAWEAQYLFLGNDGATFYLLTDAKADRRRIVALELAHPERRRTVVPEAEEALEFAVMLQDEFLCVYLQHASHRLRRVATSGEARGEILLPELGSVLELHAERHDVEAFFSFTSFLTPPSTFRYAQGGVKQLWQPALPFDAAPFTTRQVFATSKDGTRVPMFLVHHRDLEPNGRNPTLLYGYGGFNVSLTPSFNSGRLAWLERGGVLAVANLRGGGEYGRAWHRAGTLGEKQNVFDDFIACAEHLIEARVTSPERLAIQGGSNGGLLVGAAITQRPELFAAANPAVGVLDMLRFHKFTIGWAWVSDYGSPDDPEQFAALLRYSPLHNLEPGTCYPATLITTGDFDDRVVPAHSFKFAAALQWAQGCERPVLIRIQTQAGHGQGKPTRFVIAEQADVYAFLAHALELEGA